MRAQLINRCQGPHYVQMQKSKEHPTRPAGLLVINPGMNLVDSKQIAEMRKANAGFDQLFTLTVKPGKSEEERENIANFGKPMLEIVGKELADKAPLAGLAFKDAEPIVKATLDTDLLMEWSRDTKPTDQPELHRLIQDRIKELTKGISAE